MTCILAGKVRGWSSKPTHLLCQAPLCSQQTAHVYGGLAERYQSLPIIDESTEKDEVKFDMKNNGKQAVLGGSVL